jgi:uncharacterized protein (TIGR00297 family)
LGAVAAWTVGVLILQGTGWAGGAVLAAFFIGSNLVSMIETRASIGPPDAKGSQRDAWQVYANGGPAALVAALPAIDIGLKLWILTASLAAAAADTWATSVGSRSRAAPHLLTGQRVVPGTSGGVTSLGCAGAVLGALVVAGTGALAHGDIPILLAGTLIGFLGMMVDSLVGGAIQGRFHCPACNEASEQRTHRCGNPTEWKGGWLWFSNDAVNLLATSFAAVTAWMVWGWID